MRKRLLHALSLLVYGCSFQLAGCESAPIGAIVAENLRNTVVDVGTFVLESIVDDALGLEE